MSRLVFLTQKDRTNILVNHYGSVYVPHVAPVGFKWSQRLAFRSCSVYTLQEPAFSLTAAINLSPLRDSESLVEVRGQTAINSAAGGPRRQTSRQTPVSMATIYSCREWLPTPSEGSLCDTAAANKSLPEDNNGAIRSTLIKDNTHTHFAAKPPLATRGEIWSWSSHCVLLLQPEKKNLCLSFMGQLIFVLQNLYLVLWHKMPIRHVR